MKNIHVLPTDKPSRLWTNNLRRRLELDEFPESHPTNIAKHLYITSEEEIKEGCYLDLTHNIIMKSVFYSSSDKNCQKIILTTDQDLIKDGVQAIDDEFLEWFVKNPSCEEIKVEVVDDNIQWYKITIPRKNFYCGDEVDYDDKCLEQCDGCVDATGVDYGYLPEDSKQNIIDMMKGDEELGLYDEIQPEQIWNEEKKKGIKQLIQDHKQETLEEASKRFLELWVKNNTSTRRLFIEGAKWQQERSYSEEEVFFFIREALYDTNMRYDRISVEDWFKQFKKK